MKKHFTTLFLYAATMLVAVTLTGCGEEVNGGDTPAGRTEFFTGDEETRTSIQKDRRFFWEPGDKIWVKNGSTWIESNPTEITSTQAKAKFVFNTVLSDPNGYTVAYTGKNATSATQVVIAHEQTQSDWNDGTHLGVSGDCGTATAYRQENGTYKFQLEHKASYLLLYPYMGISGNYTLEKVEVLGDGIQFAGTYEFGPNIAGGGLADLPNSGTGKDNITLTCGTNGFPMSNTVPDLASTTTTYNHLFVVFAPGAHALTVKYTIVDNATNTAYSFYKDLNDEKFEPNSVYTYVHSLTIAAINYGTFYDTRIQWNASSFYQGSPQGNIYDTRTTELTAGSGSLGTLGVSVADINSVYSRNMPYWDNSTEWTFVRYDGVEIPMRGGVWIKKRAYTTAPYTGSSSNPPIIGRPADAVLSQYFFLPAYEGIHKTSYFWSKTPIAATTTYCFMISKATVGRVSDVGKHNAFMGWKSYAPVGSTTPTASSWWQ